MMIDLYDARTSAPIALGISANDAEIAMLLNATDIVGWIEEDGRVDTDTHTAVRAGSPAPANLQN